jgi:hypothetical protein
MLRELRSCVTLLRELRIVNQAYADKTSQNANIVLDLRDWLKHYVQFESLEQRTADSGCSGPRGGQ